MTPGITISDAPKAGTPRDLTLGQKILIGAFIGAIVGALSAGLQHQATKRLLR